MTSVLLAIQSAIPEITSKQVLAKQPGSRATMRGDLFETKPKRQYEFDNSAVRSGFHVFCDGAAIPNPGSGGWGFVVYHDGEEVQLASGGLVETTNNAMELTGMLKAIEWVQAHVTDGSAVTI